MHYLHIFFIYIYISYYKKVILTSPARLGIQVRDLYAFLLVVLSAEALLSSPEPEAPIRH